jgi:tetratricopeptide (TPR) repeat protein
MATTGTVSEMTTTKSRSVIGAARQHIQAKNYEEAVHLLLEHLQEEPEDIEALNELGLAYFKLGWFADAKSAYLWMWSADPTDFRATFGVGMTLQKLRQFDDAEHWFQATLTINPGFERAADRLRRLPAERAAAPAASTGTAGVAPSGTQGKNKLTTLSLPDNPEDLETYRVASRDRARIDMMNQHWYGIPWPVRALQLILAALILFGFVQAITA